MVFFESFVRDYLPPIGGEDTEFLLIKLFKESWFKSILKGQTPIKTSPFCFRLPIKKPCLLFLYKKRTTW